MDTLFVRYTKICLLVYCIGSFNEVVGAVLRLSETGNLIEVLKCLTLYLVSYKVRASCAYGFADPL